VRITDFGLALLAERTRITKPGVILGTVPYLSPEQAVTKPVDRRSDIWSLGVVLFEMITGSRPFKGNSLNATLVSVTRDPVPELRRGDEPLPSFLRSIVGKALAKNPDERYQYMDDLVVDLRAVLRGLPAVRKAGVPHSPPVDRRSAPLAPTQTLMAPQMGHGAQSPLKAVLRFTQARRERDR
jgi:serine/threonine-protein kinase